MKTKYFAGILAALSLFAALPASAHENDFRHGHGRGDITIRTERGQFSVDRNDRLFWRLMDRPYGFEPGYTYAYTDRCNRQGCQVLVFNPRYRRPVDRIFAPYLPRHDRRWAIADRRDDRRWDRDWREDWRQDWRDDDRHDDRGRDDHRGDDRGPRDGRDNGGRYDGDRDLRGGPRG